MALPFLFMSQVVDLLKSAAYTNTLLKTFIFINNILAVYLQPLYV